MRNCRSGICVSRGPCRVACCCSREAAYGTYRMRLGSRARRQQQVQDQELFPRIFDSFFRKMR